MAEARPLRLMQFLAMARLAVRRYRLSKVLVGVILLALIPVGIAALRSGVLFYMFGFAFSDPLPASPNHRSDNMDAGSTITVMRTLLTMVILKFSVVFSGLLFGNAALREETDNQTLHYLFLQPIERWLIVAGKFAGFIAIAAPILILGLFLTQLTLLLPYGLGGMKAVLIDQGRWWAILVEALAVTLALGVYAAFFMALGSVFRSIFFALAFFGWEFIAAFVPTAMKYWSMGFYLNDLLPQRALQGANMIAVLGESPGLVRSVITLTLLLAVSIAFTWQVVRRRECLYS